MSVIGMGKKLILGFWPFGGIIEELYENMDIMDKTRIFFRAICGRTPNIYVELHPALVSKDWEDFFFF